MPRSHCVQAAGLAPARHSSHSRGMSIARGASSAWSSIIFTCVACTVLSVACVASEEEVQREFDQLVAASNSCERDTDCAVVSPGCPLGCQVAINAEHKQVVERRARELIDDYERGGRACDYECVAQGRVACVAARCDFEPLDAPVDADP